ncbi:hypothetical protein SAMN02983003_2680 [Devosia enhydra]|uniref:Uncharacterized protein n=1 Tax=Devosia enhydra TaxID=665118 RepID=A0A1K2I001_9HYPH|nr:hypothetical protein [Devosia enhydra]SFZ85515.1 hypothetical protein SAMN02983003_2680 [Devosia enhydra]
MTALLPDAIATSVAAARSEIWGRFMNAETGILYDHTDAAGTVHLPTEADIAERRPNALSYQVPIEDGAFYNALLLLGQCARWQATGDADAAERAVRIARTLTRLGTVSAVPGFVARNLLMPSGAHYPCSSDDQVFPWILALWTFHQSGIPDPALRDAVGALLVDKITALEKRAWKIPSDPEDFQHYGAFLATRNAHVVRIPFVTRIAHVLTGDAIWLERYRDALAMTQPGKAAPTLALLERGAPYGPPGANSHRFWLSGSSQPALHWLARLEDDLEIRAAFERGLAANARAAVPHAERYGLFDNGDTRHFELDWRYLNAIWRPQTDAWDARQLAMQQVEWGYEVSPRGPYEFGLVTEPIFAAWVIVASGDRAFIKSQRRLIEAVLLHYDWSRLYTVPFVIVETIAHTAALSGLWTEG